MTLPLEDKIGQMLLVGFYGLDAPDYILDWLREGRIGGVILFSRNVQSPQQVARLTQQIHEAAKYPALVAIDQEGGIVARLREGFTESPGAMALSAAGNEKLAERMAQVLGTEMKALGINWTYAPAVDISYNADNPTVGVRSFGNDKEQVANMTAATVRGFQAGGVAATAKHFPGLGNTAVDTHQALAILDTSVEQLVINDLIPYRAAMHAGLASVMTTHTKFTALDSEHPATLSPIIVKRLLRGELGFEGVVCTDCMEMKAISNHYGAGESAVLAALAGIDLILFSHTRTMQEAAYDALLEAAQSGRIPLEIIDCANERIAKLKEQYAVAQIDIGQIRSAEHLETADKAAHAGTVLLKADDTVFPLNPDNHTIALIEFASYLDSEVVESGGQTGIAKMLAEALPQVETVSLKVFDTDEMMLQRAQKLAAESDVLVLATRNAHLWQDELDMVQDFISRTNHVILLCLRNPYDALVVDAGTVICTLGDATPSLQAAVDALVGEFTPSGKLPVTL